MTVELHHGDCLEVMPSIPDGSVDLILADPPFGTTQCRWDSVIPLDAMWAELKRIIKPKGAIVMTAAQPFTTILIASNIKQFKYDWVWRKPKGTGHLNAKKQPMRDKEDVVVFCDGQTTYNPQFGKGKPYTSAEKRKAPKVFGVKDATYGKYKGGEKYGSGSDGRRYPKQVLEFGLVERGTVHPTQKPVALMEYMIKTYTNEGETVMDFTMGSGTTGCAAVNTGRNFIGIEKDETYFKTASDRIAQAENQLDLAS